MGVLSVTLSQNTIDGTTYLSVIRLLVTNVLWLDGAR